MGRGPNHPGATIDKPLNKLRARPYRLAIAKAKLMKAALERQHAEGYLARLRRIAAKSPGAVSEVELDNAVLEAMLAEEDVHIAQAKLGLAYLAPNLRGLTPNP